MPKQPPITVYSSTYCGYCRAATGLLDRLKIGYEEFNLDHDPDKRRQLSEENDGYRTVPMIYVEGRFIGGYNELNKMATRGQLDHLKPQ